MPLSLSLSATISGHGKKKRAMATLQKANGSPQTDLAKHWKTFLWNSLCLKDVIAKYRFDYWYIIYLTAAT
jgi:hypothetical protein